MLKGERERRATCKSALHHAVREECVRVHFKLKIQDATVKQWAERGEKYYFFEPFLLFTVILAFSGDLLLFDSTQFKFTVDRSSGCAVARG